MGDHVSPERLKEIANLPKASGEPEWPHIRKCKTCSTLLVEFVRDSVIAEDERLNDEEDTEP